MVLKGQELKSTTTYVERVYYANKLQGLVAEYRDKMSAENLTYILNLGARSGLLL